MRVFANHAHLMPPEVMPDADLADLRRQMDALEIERAVCFAPFQRMFREAGRQDDANQWLADRIAGEESLLGFACLDPTLPESLAALERMEQWGFLGVKLHPAADEFDVADPRALDFYRAASERDLVLDFHTGLHGCRMRNLEPLKFDDLAWCLPLARLVLEHMGGVAFFEQAMAVVMNHALEGLPRVFAGITSVVRQDFGAWSLGPEGVTRCARLCGPQALIFGLDFPYHTVEQLRDQMGTLRALDLGPDGQRLLFGGNLARLLGVEWE